MARIYNRANPIARICKPDGTDLRLQSVPTTNKFTTTKIAKR